MKLFLIAMFVLFLVFPLFASGCEDDIDAMFSLGRFGYYNDGAVFMSETNWNNEGHDRDYAYDFIIGSAFYIMAIHYDWASYSNELRVKLMKKATGISCPYVSDMGNFDLSLSLKELYEQFGADSYNELGEDKLLEELRTFVYTHVELSSF